ncbi:MFS transporter [Nonomuraea sp. NN258]|uniref:MFS transporter n=1 Tax=Nonomuraea antri TaxID=2730852 RepID=UPI001568CAE2|nr:MFS transporter [Nonomuraea antri]NRQ40741.1 MFS transporter [Nonomuraea antri]
MLPSTNRTRAFLAAMFVDALGSGLYVPLTLLFITEVTGLPVTTVGLGVTVAATLGLAANPLAGVLIDRFGARRVLIGSYLVRATGFALYPLVHAFPLLIAIATMISAGDRAFYPASGTHVAALADGERRDRLYAWLATARNVAFGLGGLLSAGAVTLAGRTGFSLISLLNAASFALAALLLATTGRTTSTGDGTPALVAGGSGGSRAQARVAGGKGGGGYRRVLADRPFMRLVAAEQAFTLAHLILPVALPLYAVSVLGAPPALLGVLYTVNTLLVAAGQLPVRRLQRRSRRTHATALGGVVFVVACAGFAVLPLLPSGVARTSGLVVATLVFTLGELAHTAPSASLAAGSAPSALRGRYLAVHQMTWAVGAALSPAAFSALISAEPLLLWSGLSALLALACLALVRLSAQLPADAVAPPAKFDRR